MGRSRRIHHLLQYRTIAARPRRSHSDGKARAVLPCSIKSGQRRSADREKSLYYFIVLLTESSSARACVLIIQVFQLFSSSVQFCGRSRLPYPCRPESHKRNTCELASASCSLCRSTLSCRQVRRVTNFMCFHFCPPTRYLLPEYEAVHLLHSSSPALLPFYRCVPLRRSQGNGLKALQLQSSNGRHHSNKNSINRHLAVLHRVFQKIAVQFGQYGKLIAFRREDV